MTTLTIIYIRRLLLSVFAFAIVASANAELIIDTSGGDTWYSSFL